jgi:iron complex transport system ATP-binding protein
VTVPAASSASPPQSKHGQGPALILDGVEFGYGGRTVLHDIKLSLDAGQAMCILGENGAGKSTLLKLCAGLLTPTRGRVLIAGQPLVGLPRPIVAQKLAYLPQECSHVFPFSALEVVLMGRYARARTQFEGIEDLQAAEAAMAATNVLGLRDRSFNQLSGGERRRVLLAQALAQDTPVVLLDEPTAGLDPAHALSLGRALEAICHAGKALLFATHDLNLAARFIPRAVLLQKGEIRLAGPTLEVLAQAGPLLGVELHLGHLPSGVPFAIPT